jgi:hypothetical protein
MATDVATVESPFLATHYPLLAALREDDAFH